MLWRGQIRAAAVKSLGLFVFAAGYAPALLLVFRQVAEGTASVGDSVLVLALAVQTTMQITSAALHGKVLVRQGEAQQRKHLGQRSTLRQPVCVP